MAFKRPLPEWNNPGVEPPQSKKDVGWLGREKPPAQWHNWFQHLVFKALEELQQNAAHVTFGATAPTSPDVNDLWVDTSGTPVLVLKAWDGTQWITVGAVNSVNGKTGNVELTAADVGAASLTAFNEHLNDSVRHITQSERSNWNNHLNKVVTELQGVHGLRVQNGQIEYWDGTQWVTIDTEGAVISVNGKTGAVELTASDVGAASQTSFNSHVNDSTRHITQSERNSWNSHLNDSTRHITQTERNNWNDHLNDSTRHITQSERTNWNNGIITTMSSNSNGYYVRWANGLQICWGMKQGSTTPRAGQWNYEYVTFPASFYNSDYTVVVTYYGFPGLPHGYWQKYAAENRITTRFAIVEAVQQDATQAMRYFWMAIGRWK